MPFAINEATRFISPTKTLEYLAGGPRRSSRRRSRDVVRHYADLDGRADRRDAGSLRQACEAALRLAKRPTRWLGRGRRAAGAACPGTTTFDRMAALRRRAVDGAEARAPAAGDRRRRARAARLAPRSRPTCWSSAPDSRAASWPSGWPRQSGKRVLVIDRRPHIAGNAYDDQDAAGLLVHRYGPHIFHTNSEDICRLSVRLHRVAPLRAPGAGAGSTGMDRADADQPDDDQHPLWSRSGERRGGRGLPGAAAPRPCPRSATSEDLVVSKVGRDLYEKFFRGYTRKQWGMDASELDKSVAARVPARTNTDDRYFTDRFQSMPRDGYTRMFEAMLDHPLDRGAARHRLSRRRSAKRLRARGLHRSDRRIFRVPVRQAALPQSLRFDHVTLDQPQFQTVGTVNYPDRGRALHADHRVQASDRPEPPQDEHRLRISLRRRRSLLPGAAPGEPGVVQAVRGAGAAATPT